MRSRLQASSSSATVVAHLMLLLGVSAMMLVTAEEVVPRTREHRLTHEERMELLRRNEERHAGRKGCEDFYSAKGTSKPFPTAPKSFSTRVEVALQNEKKLKVIYGEEAFDGELNTGVVKYELGEGVILGRPYDYEEIIHYSKILDEALFVKTDLECQDEGGEDCNFRQRCYASNMESLSVELDQLFGFVDINNQAGYAGASGILQWGPEWGYTYSGVQDCHGMDCDVYETCVEEKNEATVYLTYYWSSTDWIIEGSRKQVPVAVEIYAKKQGIIFSRKINERFDFYNFLRDIRPDMDELMPPAQVYCKDRKSQYDPPKIPHHSSYNSEIITGFNLPFPAGENETEVVKLRGTFYQTEFYDWDLNISRTDYIPFDVVGIQRRYDDYTERIHEFNQGLTYRIRPRLKTCEVKMIENKTSFGDVNVNDDGTVSMQSPLTLMHMDEPMQYNGEHWTRGVSADVWVGRKRNPIVIFFEETYVWYYADVLTKEEITFRSPNEGHRKNAFYQGASTEDRKAFFRAPLGAHLRMDDNAREDKPVVISSDRVPIRFEKYLSIAEAGPHTIYNIYDYMSDVPTTHYHDISLCYNSSDSARSYIFDLPGNSLKKVKNLRDNLKYAALVALAYNSKISPLRINRLVMEERDDVVRILFTLLEKPPLPGDGIFVSLENDLEVARQLIQESIDKSQLILMVPVGHSILHPNEPKYEFITALPNTMKEVDRSEGNHYVHNAEKGYTSGDMGGLAFGTIILGLLVGVGAFMVLQRESWAAKTFSLPRVARAREGGGGSKGIVVSMNTDLTACEADS